MVMTLESHKLPVAYDDDPKFIPPTNRMTISYFPGGEKMISRSDYKTVRLLDFQSDKEIDEARVDLSRDGRWGINTGGYLYRDPKCGELEAREVKTMIMKRFEGYSQAITCIDISADSKLLASEPKDRTVHILDLDAENLQVAGPFECVDWVDAIRFSQNSKKLAVKSDVGKSLEVWNMKAGELDANDKTIVAAFTFKLDDNKT
ncbi:hypothetical protein K503DRAFT_820197 [Rhizopogon vinicolor AM-OR11-026]|uniref:Uncharacterized protein n=1 Tax=Rhizopogon vinicolor AM-OR11-026 TaxID=1314800 RepID=A0A1B7MZ54_9AGAM|nr:hypothetical protein K503DRAFT_820197 [Rhizopogon vinicolor AM-OR11-026]